MRARAFLRALQGLDSASADRVVREALTLSAIVAYCRPFVTSYDANRDRRRWIPEELAAELPVSSQRLHARILEERKQAWAHTDWVAHEPRGHTNLEGVPVVVSRNPWAAFEANETREFLQLIDEVDGRLQPLSVSESGRPSHGHALDAHKRTRK